MVILIDTNVILDYLVEREGFFEDARTIMELCANDKIHGCVAFHSLSNLWFILRKKTRLHPQGNVKTDLYPALRCQCRA